MIEFEYMINDIPCMIKADVFTEDPSVGIPLGPEELWAESLVDGVEIPISEQLEDRLLKWVTEAQLEHEAEMFSDYMDQNLEEEFLGNIPYGGL